MSNLMRVERGGVLALAALLLFGAPASAQIDLTGEWAPQYHEDQPERLAGPSIGDFAGLPINDAARMMAETWSADILAVPEHQCKPHPADYSPRGPAPLRIWKEVEPATQEVIALRTHIFWQAPERTIWMDGRPHPPDYAEYTWDGFSTGRCERGMLVVTTTHMKYGYHRRNGVPASIKSKMTEYFVRHGTEMTIMQFTEDPVYLEEILARTTDFQLNPGQNVNAPGFGFEIVDEIASWPEGFVPHWPFGTEHREFAETLGVPYEATQGYKEAMYPEYLPKLRKMMSEAEKPTSTR